MNSDFLASLVRHVITGAGATLIAKGYTDQAGVELIAGGAATLVGLVWSYFSKKQAAATLAAATTTTTTE